MHPKRLLSALPLALPWQAAAASLLSGNGQTAAIPTWDIQQTAQLGNQSLTAASQPGYDVSSWSHIPLSRCTLMACLLSVGIFLEDALFYSDWLNQVSQGDFLQEWLYRNEFSLDPATGKHFLLETNGITPKADVFFNGHQIADKVFQSGAYGGHTYDVTGLVGEKNALLIQTHPTDYNYDFALGFVDWNPYPPDNGTGVWRNVTIKQTGSVALGPLSVLTQTTIPIEKSSAVVTLRATARNLENRTITFAAEGLVAEEGGASSRTLQKTVTLGPLASTVLSLSTTYEAPKIWWPKQWGGQPLYSAQLSVSEAGALSDTQETLFGVRNVTSTVNSHNDRIFNVNGHPFEVLGGGYCPDMFLRWDAEKFKAQAQYVLDMGLNTIRLEGKMEQPEMYEIADRIGLMVMPGWECCDKWEAWSYNDQLSVSPVPVWTAADYATANASMRHEAAMQQTHPSILMFFVGSDFWPNDEAAAIYIEALDEAGWQVPIVASADHKGYPKPLGPSGVKMDGPYDWVPPNYWYDTEPATDDDRLGAAYGLNSELGAGVGTPELGSLKKFLSPDDLKDLWTQPDKGLFHMSTNVSSFHDRSIYNGALYNRYGPPTSLEDYVLKAQITDYEATRAQYEGYSALWNAPRPATGAIYWMLNNAWPSLHWNQFDYYLHPAGSYFGTKTGSRLEHVAYHYIHKSVYLINHSLDRQGTRTVQAEILSLDGKVVSTSNVTKATVSNTSTQVLQLPALSKITSVVFLKLSLLDGKNTLSRNVYWIAPTIDTLDWDNSTWYHTPVTKYANFTALSHLSPANVSATVTRPLCKTATQQLTRVVTLENHSSAPAFFIRLNLVGPNGLDITPVIWSDNYVTLWPNEKLDLKISYAGDSAATAVEVSGGNVKGYQVALP